MMKAVLILSALFLGTMSLAGAHDEHEHHGPEHKHDSSIGKPGIASKVSRTVTVDMSDAMRFSPSEIAVKKGETIRFLVKNSGKLKHEMVLGSPVELKEHAEMMRKMPEMQHVDANQVTLDPGTSGEIIWQFSKAGPVEFACLQPGHFEAGMKGQVKVAAK